MRQPVPPQSALERAQWELDNGRPGVAFQFCLASAQQAPPEAKRIALTRALDICLSYFSADSAETIDVAEQLLNLTGGTDGRALKTLGMAYSLQARDARRNTPPNSAWDNVAKSEELLTAATKLQPVDADAWGTLGGLYKRAANWAFADGQKDLCADYQRKALDAYKKGMELGHSPYPTLNYLEYRAVYGATGGPPQPETEIRPGHGGETRAQRDRRLAHDGVTLVRQDERAALEQALYLRRRQFDRGEDAPWAAFDLARGKHYLKRNVPRFLHDLQVAIEDARRVARRPADRWMVQSAANSLLDLSNADVKLDGLDEALLLTRRAVMADDWYAGNWGPQGKPADFMMQELNEARAELAQLAKTSALSQVQLDQFIRSAKARWSEADEDRFSAALAESEAETEAAAQADASEIASFKQRLEPPALRQLRVLWKLFGKDALAWTVTSAANLIVPGSGSAAKLVTKYLAHQMKL